MAQLERVLLMAEDELTQYSTDSRKIEKLRQKIALSVPLAEQQHIKAAILADLPTDGFSKLVEQQRQTVALPLWGIAGLGLLFGISMAQPLDGVVAIAAAFGAIKVQQWGWKLQAKRLVLQTLEDIESRMANPDGS